MVLSKGVQVLRAVNLLKNVSQRQVQVVRNSHDFNYRASAKPASKNTYLMAEIVAGTAWWWVLWHLFTEPGHVFGEFEYPDPRKWTNEELGIPPAD